MVNAWAHCSSACPRSSGSASAFSETSVAPERVSGLVALARDAMQARGKAELGGKTVLDSLDAVARATEGVGDADAVADAAARAADEALDAFRDERATVGRARMFGDKTIGMDDPGMLAMQRIVRALAAREA